MEFDEMKKIWDTQTKAPMYAFNEKALHNRILSKQKQGYHITNFSELLCIITYGLVGCFILGMNLSRQRGDTFMYILSAWMLAMALYCLVSRVRRIQKDHQFDRSLRGDLRHAISVAAYQVRLSLIMRWNILPVAILIVLGVQHSGKSIWITVDIVIFFILTNYAAGWEHRIYKNRKRELEIVQDKLAEEEPDDSHRSHHTAGI